MWKFLEDLRMSVIIRHFSKINSRQSVTSRDCFIYISQLNAIINNEYKTVTVAHGKIQINRISDN